MNWASTESGRLRVLWRLHLLLVALRSDARRGRDCDPGLQAIIDAIDGAFIGGIPEFERRLEAAPWSGSSWGGSPNGVAKIADAGVAAGFAEALLLGCRAAIGASAAEVTDFADAMEYIPATLCRGDLSVLTGLDDPGESSLVRLVGRELRNRRLP